jgi:hypothetical protein
MIAVIKAVMPAIIKRRAQTMRKNWKILIMTACLAGLE